MSVAAALSAVQDLAEPGAVASRRLMDIFSRTASGTVIAPCRFSGSGAPDVCPGSIFRRGH